MTIERDPTRLGRRASLHPLSLAFLLLSACARPEAPTPAPPTREVRTVLDSPRLPDFSFAGYHMGERNPPRVPAVAVARDFGVTGDGTTDDTRALEAALDKTHDGALVLGPGRFVLRDALRMTRSHVVLRGAGPDKTALVMPESLADLHPVGDPLHGMLYGFIDARGGTDGETIGQVALPQARGDRRLQLAAGHSLSNVRPGDLVRLRMDNSEALLRQLLGPSLALGAQTPRDYDHCVDWETPVEAVSGDRLLLTRPLRVDVRPEWAAEVLTARPRLEEIGVEDLSFEFAGAPRRAHDGGDPGAQSWAEEGFRAVYFRGVTNGWIRNVAILDADDAIEIEDSRHCQVEGVRLAAVHRASPSGHHGLWAKNAQDCLFRDFRLDTQLDEDLTVEAFANGNVFTSGAGQRMNLDHHRNAPYENLFTDLDVGDGSRLWKSGGDVNRGPHAGVRETLWNVRHHGDLPPLPGALRFDRPVDAGWPLLNLVGVPGYEPTTERESVWVVELAGLPPNLYEEQRRARVPSR